MLKYPEYSHGYYYHSLKLTIFIFRLKFNLSVCFKGLLLIWSSTDTSYVHTL